MDWKPTVVPIAMALALASQAAPANAEGGSGIFFLANEGQTMRWQRIAPGYGAYSLDQRKPEGPMVFAGGPDTIEGIMQSLYCEAVGCHVYRLGQDGQVKRLFSEYEGKDGFGIVEVALSGDGGMVAASSINSFDQGDGSYSVPKMQGRVWLWRDGSVSRHTFKEQTLAVATVGGRFIAAAGSGRLLQSIGSGWRSLRPGPSCAFYDINSDGPKVLLAGYSGTYALNRRGVARKVGPFSDTVWSSHDGRAQAIGRVSSTNPLLLSRDGGGSWKRQVLIDEVGAGRCQNRVNDASACNDNVDGARIGFKKIAGTYPDDLWAFGGRADIPGGRVYRYISGDRWQRVPFPADIYWASDAVLLNRGRPLVATGEGIWQAAPVS